MRSTARLADVTLPSIELPSTLRSHATTQTPAWVEGLDRKDTDPPLGEEFNAGLDEFLEAICAKRPRSLPECSVQATRFFDR